LRGHFAVLTGTPVTGHVTASVQAVSDGFHRRLSARIAHSFTCLTPGDEKYSMTAVKISAEQLEHHQSEHGRRQQTTPPPGHHTHGDGGAQAAFCLTMSDGEC
jgi:hypothetical protein